MRPRSTIVVYAISLALLWDFALIRSLLSCCLAFAYQYCAAQEGGRLHTEHIHFADEEKCVCTRDAQSPEEVSEHDDSFGARLRGLRKEAGLTQQELAERAGLSLNAVNALERGVRRHPYPHTVRSLAEALGLSEQERSSLLAAVPDRAKTAAAVAPPLTYSKPPCRVLRPRSLAGSGSSAR